MILGVLRRQIIRTMSSKKRILVNGPLDNKPALDILQQPGHEVIVYEGDDLLSAVKGIDGLYTFGPQVIDKQLLDAAGDNLKVVSAMSVGVDAHDLNEYRKRGIMLGHTPGVLTDAVADLTLALILCTARRVVEQAGIARNGEWGSWHPFSDLGVGLRGATVGIVGLGRIGCGVAKRLRPFGVSRIVYNNRNEKKEMAAEVGAEYISLDDLYRQSDFVVCCCSLNPSTQEMFNENAFKLMKNAAIFINISRGGVVEQKALYDALKNNEIRAAGIDVTTPEPLPPTHELFTLKNCVILPHIGSAEEQTRTDMATLAANNLVRALDGLPMVAQYPL